MSQFGYESPGSVKNQVGRSLIVIRERITHGDTDGLADQVQYLVALAAPFFVEGDREKLPELKADADETTLFRACMDTVETVLTILSARSIYAYLPPKTTSAADLAVREEP